MENFIDYYEVLQISPNADVEMIQRVYRLLAQRYHPDNKDAGDADVFKRVLEAHRVLSDPERRAAYDVEHRSVRRLWWKIFDQPQDTRGVEGEKRKRNGILALLYTKRLYSPHEPGLSIMEIEDLLGCPREHLEFSLWYLREIQYIQRSDSGRYVITAKGVEASETTGEVKLRDNRLLTGPEDPAPAPNVRSWADKSQTAPRA